MVQHTSNSLICEMLHGYNSMDPIDLKGTRESEEGEFKGNKETQGRGDFSEIMGTEGSVSGQRVCENQGWEERESVPREVEQCAGDGALESGHWGRRELEPQ